MSTHTATAETVRDRRVSGWSSGLAALAVTLLIGKWTAIHIEPNHAGLYLLVVGGFLVSTLPIRRIVAD